MYYIDIRREDHVQRIYNTVNYEAPSLEKAQVSPVL